MNIYVESNFILELALVQEQSSFCGQILRFCEAGDAFLVIPAFCLAEPFQTLARYHDERLQSKNVLDKALESLSRSSVHALRINELRRLADPLLIASRKDESTRLEVIQGRLLRSAGVIPLESSVWLGASECRRRFGLAPQDALVCASILSHLKSSGAPQSCFVTRDRDFRDPDLTAELKRYNCTLLSSLEDGFRYVSRPR